MFRDLSPEDEAKFRQWARDHFDRDKEPLPLWHPVVRDEWAKLTEAAESFDPRREVLSDPWRGSTWHGIWTPEHPVQNYHGSTPMYVSIEDAADRLANPDMDRAEVTRRLHEGETVRGYRLLVAAPQ